jgi:hypothetical protein
VLYKPSNEVRPITACVVDVIDQAECTGIISELLPSYRGFRVHVTIV